MMWTSKETISNALYTLSFISLTLTFSELDRRLLEPPPPRRPVRDGQKSAVWIVFMQQSRNTLSTFVYRSCSSNYLCFLATPTKNWIFVLNYPILTFQCLCTLHWITLFESCFSFASYFDCHFTL